MAEPVRARRLSDEEGRRLQQIVRRGRHESVRVRRALIIMASASWRRRRLLPVRFYADEGLGRAFADVAALAAVPVRRLPARAAQSRPSLAVAADLVAAWR
jgi:hypothetical protein